MGQFNPLFYEQTEFRLLFFQLNLLYTQELTSLVSHKSTKHVLASAYHICCAGVDECLYANISLN